MRLTNLLKLTTKDLPDSGTYLEVLFGGLFVLCRSIKESFKTKNAFCIILVACVLPSVTAFEAVDTGNVIKISNDFLTVIVDPLQGGSISSLSYMGKELIPQGQGVGSMKDVFWEEIAEPEFKTASYSYEILKDSPAVIKIHLWARGTKGQKKWIVIHKTLNIFRNSCLLQVDYRIENMPQSMAALSFSPWSHNVFGLQGEICDYYFPTVDGVKTVRHIPGEALGNRYEYNAARNWTAFLAEKANVGLVGLFDFRYLRDLYNYFGADYVTMEWMFGRVDIPAGGFFETTNYYLPFTGLKKVSGSSKEAVIEISPSETEISVGIATPAELSAKLLLQCRLLPDGPLKTFKELDFKGKVNSVERIVIPSTNLIKTQGTYVFKATLSNEGTILCTAEEAFVNGNGTGSIKLEPMTGKLFTKTSNYFPFHPTKAFETPHINWGIPYALGTSRGLFIANAMQEREVIELAQRIDVDYIVSTYLADYSQVGWAQPEGTKISNGMEAIPDLIAKDYSFILLSGSFNGVAWECDRGDVIEWEKMPENVRNGILEKVKGGKGLVYIYPKNLSGEMKELFEKSSPVPPDSYIFAGVPELPGLDRSKVTSVNYGSSTILFLNYEGQCITPALANPPNYNYYDYFYSFIGKCVNFVSGKMPKMQFKELAFTGGIFSISFKDIESCTAEIEVLDIGAEVEFKSSFEVTEPELTVKIPQLKQGMHFANIILKDTSGKVINWASKQIFVDNGLKGEVELGRTFFAPCEELTGSVNLMNSANTGRKFKLELSWRDAYQRLVKQTIQELDIPSSNGSTLNISVPGKASFPFSFRLDNPLSCHNELVVNIYDGETLLLQMRKLFYVPQTKWDDYKVIVWHQFWLPDYLNYDLSAKAYRNVGVDVLDLPAFEHIPAKIPAVVKNNMEIAFVGLNRFDLPPDEFAKAQQTLVRTPCFSDSEYQKKLRDHVYTFSSKVGGYKPLCYSIGDESSSTTYSEALDTCFCPLCINGFRKWAEAAYGTLSNLNKQWDTSFKTWAELMPMTAKQVLARKSMNFAPWADFRTYMDDVYMNILSITKSSVREADSQGVVGECGTNPMSAYGGNDWYKKMKIWDFIGPYSELGNQGQYQRSFTKGPIVGWTGYTINEIIEMNRLWWGVLNGELSTAFWYTPGLLNPDFTPSILGKVMKEFSDDVKAGLGKRLITSTRASDGIAIHYSQASMQAAYILKAQSGRDYVSEFYESQASFIRLLEDMHLQFNFFASEQIEDGILLKSKCRYLIMPLSRAVSEKERDAIRKFAEAGGVVIADTQTGLFNEHLTPYEQPVLDDLFGIRRLGATMLSERDTVKMKFGEMNIQVSSFDTITASANPLGKLEGKSLQVGKLKLTSASKGTSAMVMNKIGNGKFLYLNFLSSYSNMRSAMQESPTKKLFSVLFKEIGLIPQYDVVSSKNGTPLPYIQTTVFENGKERYIGVLQDPVFVSGLNFNKESLSTLGKFAKDVRITLPSPAYIYNMRTHEYLGRISEIPVNLKPGIAEFFALLPVKALTITASISKPLLAQGDAVECSISIQPAGNYILKLACLTQDGKRMEWYDRKLELKDGTGIVTLPLAADQPLGVYTILIKEFVTGTEQKATFTIKKQLSQ